MKKETIADKSYTQHRATYKIATKGAFAGIVGNFFLAVFKISAGIVGRSAAVLADGIHAFTDISTSVIVLLGIKIAQKPADARHPYGHGKAEFIAAKTVAIFLFIIAALIIKEAAETLIKGERVPPLALFVPFVVAVAFLIEAWLSQYVTKIGVSIESSSLLADAAHHRAHALSSLAVLIGCGAAILGGERWRFMDRVAAIVVALLILYTSIKILRRSWSQLMDVMPSAATIEKIKDVARTVEGVMDVEAVMARKSGFDLLIDIHAEVDKNMTVEESHKIAQRLRNTIQEKIPEAKSVLVHIEPYFPGDH